MTRAAWTDIALALAQLRDQLNDHADRARSDRKRLDHIERAVGVELAARAVCRVLKARSSRFDSRRFLRLVASQK
jgi:hypothetical protein